MEHMENQILVRGSLLGLPEISHENHGKVFLRFTLEVPRLSGTSDLLPVIARQELLDHLDPSSGSQIYVEGQIRSHNVHREDGRHLQIFLFASLVSIEEGEPLNQVTVEGNLCRDPVFRRTPLGREICDVMLAVPRAYHRADYLPCILWGKTAQDASLCRTGDRITIRGRLQSRTYQKLTEDGPQQRTAYEISAMNADIPVDLY